MLTHAHAWLHGSLALLVAVTVGQALPGVPGVICITLRLQMGILSHRGVLSEEKERVTWTDTMKLEDQGRQSGGGALRARALKDE